MKPIVLLALVVVCALAIIESTSAVPTDTTTTVSTKRVKEPKEIKETATASKDVKAAKEAAKRNKKDCAKECGLEYDPICVHDPNDANFKPRTFGTQCALDVHNCEMGTKLVMKNKGECPGSGGVVLS
ncbi:hypothetical protein QLX08_001285 [Tetragonisca angustula]|uniref:Kazal-like domain-containing protein n=1 Tax=Tetragonisca angustula TaxID=166442 RepID=A0AAW1AFZ8_9HYME